MNKRKPKSTKLAYVQYPQPTQHDFRDVVSALRRLAHDVKHYGFQSDIVQGQIVRFATPHGLNGQPGLLFRVLHWAMRNDPRGNLTQRLRGISRTLIQGYADKKNERGRWPAAEQIQYFAADIEALTGVAAKGQWVEDTKEAWASRIGCNVKTIGNWINKPEPFIKAGKRGRCSIDISSQLYQSQSAKFRQ